MVIEAEGVSKSFDGKEVFHGVDLILARQEKVALVGKNGAGKTTFTRIILGLEQAQGELKLGHNVDIGYYAQNQAEELDGNLTVLETLEEVAVGDVRKNLRGLLGSFLFSGEDVDKKVKVLSGGEKARLAMCKLLLHPYNFLILDEPTNHLDIKSKEVLKQALKAYDGTLMVVSHDRDFLADMTDLVYEVTPTGLQQYIGDIRQFLHEKHAASIRAYEAGNAKKVHLTKDKPKPAETAKPELSYKERKALEKEERTLRNRVSKAEALIAERETAVEKLNEQIAQTAPEERSTITDLAYQYEQAQHAVQQAMEQWEAATLALEAFERRL